MGGDWKAGMRMVQKLASPHISCNIELKENGMYVKKMVDEITRGVQISYPCNWKEAGILGK